MVGDADAVSSTKGITLVAREAVSVVAVEGLAKRISSGADSVAEERVLGALEADLSVPLGAEEVRR